MFEWRLLTKEEKDKIISEYMEQDEEIDFMEYARRKKDMFFTSDVIEYWERFSKRLKELRILYIKKREKEKQEREKAIKEIEKRREIFKKIRQEREMLKKEEQGIRLTKTGYETNKEEYKYGEFKDTVIEEKPKTSAKRVKLSEMSDAELKEYYKKKEEERERRKRLQEEIKKEEYAAECRELEEELDKMSYKEIEEKYWKTVKYSGYVEQRFIYYDEKGKEDKQKSDIIRNAYESKEEIKAYRKQQEEIMKQKAEQDRQYRIEGHKDNINENRAVLIFIIGVLVFIFMVATNFEDIWSIVIVGGITAFWIIISLLIVKEQNDSSKREIKELETHKQ